MNSNLQTLDQWIAAGPLAAPDALRIAMHIAERLRHLHDQGTAHGALSPATVAIEEGAIALLSPAPAGEATPYTAPELLEGKPADARSDIFSFGAILYEMLTGRRAFDGDPQALAAALGSGSPAPSGSAALDRVLRGCVAKSPDNRYQRIQKVMLELRMLLAATRRGAPAPVSYAPPAPAPVSYAPPAPARQPAAVPASDLEGRIAARLAEQERTVASVAQVANEVLKTLREQQAPPAMPRRSFTRGFSAGPLDDSMASRLEHALDILSDKVARMDLLLSSAVERIQKLEQSYEEFDTDAAAMRDSVTRDIRNFERALKAQGAAIESARTAMGQTDDLVERVVEALDSLQSMFVNTAEERSLAS